MRHTITALAALAILLPDTALAQESTVARHTFNFLDRWLDIAVVADAPGVLQVVRGPRGRVDVAARAQHGLAGYGLGGDLTRRLDLTALGSDDAQFIVAVPEHVSVRVFMPDGTSATIQSRETGATLRWLAPPFDLGSGLPQAHGFQPIADGAAAGPFPGDRYLQPASQGHAPAILPHRVDGMIIAHSTRWLPSAVDVPDLAAVRSLEIRFEGSEFRIAASRPLTLAHGDRSRFELRLDGEPMDVVLFVPQVEGPFAVRAGGVQVAELKDGRPGTPCDNVVIHTGPAGGTWLSFHPQDGRIVCR